MTHQEQLEKLRTSALFHAGAKLDNPRIGAVVIHGSEPAIYLYTAERFEEYVSKALTNVELQRDCRQDVPDGFIHVLTRLGDYALHEFAARPSVARAALGGGFGKRPEIGEA